MRDILHFARNTEFEEIRLLEYCKLYIHIELCTGNTVKVYHTVFQII